MVHAKELFMTLATSVAVSSYGEESFQQILEGQFRPSLFETSKPCYLKASPDDESLQTSVNGVLENFELSAHEWEQFENTQALRIHNSSSQFELQLYPRRNGQSYKSFELRHDGQTLLCRKLVFIIGQPSSPTLNDIPINLWFPF